MKALVAAALAAGLLSASPAFAAAEPAKAATCKACHQDEKDFVGPAFKQIAAKYAGNADAVAMLAVKVQKGGTGVWPNAQGKARVMPPNNVTEAEAKALVEWVLSKK